MVSSLQLQSDSTALNGRKPGVTAVVENITPAIAKFYLETQKNNRTLNKRRVKLYAKQMERGEWVLSSQGIAFDSDGCLIDGQHRLAAVSESGSTIQMLVIRGCGKESQAILDSGQARTVAQSMNIAGIKVHTVEVAVLRAMFFTPTRPTDAYTRGLSRSQLIELFPKYEASVRFAAKRTGTRAITFSATRGLVARAHYCGANVDRLARFLYVFDTGYSEGSSDFPAISLRSAYFGMNRSHEKEAAFYFKSITAIKNFLNYSTAQKLPLAKDVPWKIAELDGNTYFDA